MNCSALSPNLSLLVRRIAPFCFAENGAATNASANFSPLATTTTSFAPEYFARRILVSYLSAPPILLTVALEIFLMLAFVLSDTDFSPPAMFINDAFDDLITSSTDLSIALTLTKSIGALSFSAALLSDNASA